MEDIVSGLKMLLELEGATVHVATSARDALKVLERERIDLLVSDIAMPDMDDYALLEQARKQNRHARLPAIALTDFGRVENAERARMAGFSAYVSKPVPLDVLIKTAAGLCRKAEN